MSTIHRNTLHTLLLGFCVLAVPGHAWAQDASSGEDKATGNGQAVTNSNDDQANRDDPQSDEGEATTLEAVVVSSAIVYRKHIDVPAPKLVYGKNFFNNFEPVTVGDQLRRVPGVAFASDIGESVKPMLRGLGHGYTQILVNGRRVPGVSNDRAVAVDRIPAEIVDRIEIIRSPTADISSSGIGGTINIILKDGATLPPGVIVRVGTTWDKKSGDISPNVALSWSGQNDAKTVFYSLTVEAQKRRNTKYAVQGAFEEDSVGFAEELASHGWGRSLESWDDRSSSTAVERQEQLDERESRDLSVNGSVTWKISDRSTLRLDARALHTEREEHETTVIHEGDGTPGGFSGLEHEYEDSPIEKDTRGVGATFYQMLGESTDFEAHIGYNSVEANITKNKYKGTRSSADEFESEIDEIEDQVVSSDALHADFSITHHMLDLAEAWGMTGLELEYGVQASQMERDYSLTVSVPGDAEGTEGRFNYKERRIDGYGKVDLYITPQVTLTGGLRWENTRTEQTFTNTVYAGGAVAGVTTGQADRDVSMVNPSAHLRWRLSPSDTLRFSVAKTVRRPAINQLVPSIALGEPEDEDITVGNSDLDMEEALGFDLGYEHMLGRYGVASINLFTRDVSNLIGLVKTTRPVTDVGQDPDDYNAVYTYMNLGDATVRGVELDLSTPLTFIGAENTGVFANYTWLQSSWTSRVTGKDISINDQPSYVYNVGITQDIPSWNFSFGAFYNRQGASTFNTIGEMEKTEYDGNLSFFMEKDFGDTFVLRLTGKNLLDACSYQMERSFGGDSAAVIVANQAAFNVEAFEVERECASPTWSLTLRAVF